MHSGGFCHLVSACSNLYIFYFSDDLILAPRCKKENWSLSLCIASLWSQSCASVYCLCLLFVYICVHVCVHVVVCVSVGCLCLYVPLSVGGNC